MSDPANEAGTYLRTVAIQAVQTAMMISQLLRGRRGEQRSRIEHRMRVDQAGDAAAREKAIHQQKLEGYQQRRGHAEQLHELEKEERTRRMERADADLARRDRLADAAEDRENQIHDRKTEGYTNREQRAVEVHDLEKQERRQRMQIRARAAGFSENLAKADVDTAMMAETIAGFAAATATADLGPQQRQAADAFADRLRGYGLDPDDIIAAATAQHDALNDFSNATTDLDSDPDNPERRARFDQARVDAEEAGLSDEQLAQTFLHAPGPGGDDPTPTSDPEHRRRDTPPEPIVERIEEFTTRIHDRAETAAQESPPEAPGAAVAEAIRKAGLDRMTPHPADKPFSLIPQPPYTGPARGVDEGLDL